jgi:hypothetical protein
MPPSSPPSRYTKPAKKTVVPLKKQVPDVDKMSKKK